MGIKTQGLERIPFITFAVPIYLNGMDSNWTVFFNLKFKLQFSRGIAFVFGKQSFVLFVRREREKK